MQKASILKKFTDLIKIKIDSDKQLLELLDDDLTIRSYPVSTAQNGLGEITGSFCTPRGKHLIRAKIGAGLPESTVFVRRRPTGEMFDESLSAAFPERDWVLGRILWLSGCEPGFNRLGAVDTMRRYIYIHGTSDEDSIGKPVSHGCIRMKKRDVVELFDLVRCGTPVEIT